MNFISMGLKLEVVREEEVVVLICTKITLYALKLGVEVAAVSPILRTIEVVTTHLWMGLQTPPNNVLGRAPL